MPEQDASHVVDGDATRSPDLDAGHLVAPEHGPILSELHIPPGDAVHQRRTVDKWDLGPFTHVHEVQLGRSAALKGFRFQARGGHIGELLYANQYSDEFSGISGNGPGRDPVIADFVLSGWARFENEGTEVTIGPGQVVFRDTARPWRFRYGPGTSSRILIVPREQVLRHAAFTGRPHRLLVADAALAEVRLLHSYLDLARSLGNAPFSRLGRHAGQEAGVRLLMAAMGATSAAEAGGCLNVTLANARRFIDEHLDDPNLAPATVANALHTSVRSLHRAFGEAGDSVMAYVRRQRLQCAQTQLMDPSARVSEVAARWHFSDTSHFIRQFKAAYGVTPAVFIKRERESN